MRASSLIVSLARPERQSSSSFPHVVTARSARRHVAIYPPRRVWSSVPSPDVAEYTEVRVGTKFLKAAQWAADRHVEYAGDLPGIPTVAQVLGLATLVLEDGGSQREAIAAMLLDALADDVPRNELRGFGKKTMRLVVATHAHRGTIAPGRVPV